jgi:hypothetical protein
MSGKHRCTFRSHFCRRPKHVVVAVEPDGSFEEDSHAKSENGFGSVLDPTQWLQVT